VIVYTGSSNEFCDLSMVAVSLMNEGFSTDEVVLEILEYCASYGLHVYQYDVENMVIDLSLESSRHSDVTTREGFS